MLYQSIVTSLKIYMYQKDIRVKELFLGYIIYCPFFCDAHESDSDAVNPFDILRWQNKYPLCERFIFCSNIIESINKL